MLLERYSKTPWQQYGMTKKQIVFAITYYAVATTYLSAKNVIIKQSVLLQVSFHLSMGRVLNLFQTLNILHQPAELICIG